MAAAKPEDCIRFWESEFQYSKLLMSPATQVFVESTIKHLKELKQIKDREDKNVDED